MCVDDTLSATHLHSSIHPQWILWDMGSTDFVSFSYSCLSFFQSIASILFDFQWDYVTIFLGQFLFLAFFHWYQFQWTSNFLRTVSLNLSSSRPNNQTYLIYSSPWNYAGRAEVRTWMIPPANDLVALPSFLVICNRKFFEPAKEGQRPHRSRDYLTTKAKSFACLPTYHRGPPSNSRSKFWQRHPCSDICCWLEACLSLEVDWF